MKIGCRKNLHRNTLLPFNSEQRRGFEVAGNSSKGGGGRGGRLGGAHIFLSKMFFQDSSVVLEEWGLSRWTSEVLVDWVGVRVLLENGLCALDRKLVHFTCCCFSFSPGESLFPGLHLFPYHSLPIDRQLSDLSCLCLLSISLLPTQGNPIVSQDLA